MLRGKNRSRLLIWKFSLRVAATCAAFCRMGLETRSYGIVLAPGRLPSDASGYAAKALCPLYGRTGCERALSSDAPHGRCQSRRSQRAKQCGAAFPFVGNEFRMGA